MADASDIKQEISDIQQTNSGLIEAGSLTPILEDMVDLSVALGIQTCTNVSVMQALDSSDVGKAFVLGIGFFVYQPLSGAVPAGSFASNDGQGYWQRQDLSRLSSLLDVTLSNPQNGHVIKFNTGTGKWENGVQSIGSVAWNALTGLPANIAGISAADQLIKVITAGSNKNIGTAALGDDFIGLFPNGTALTNPLRSVVLAPQIQQYMTNVTDSIVITSQASLRPGTTPFSLTRCIIIGDVGDLSGYFVSNALTDVIVFGTAGTITFINSAAGAFVTTAGNGFSSDVMGCQNFAVGTFAEFQGRVNIAALPVYANAAAALSGEGGTGFLWRNSAGQVFVTY